MFTLIDHEDGTATLFDDGVRIGTIGRERDDYQVYPSGNARAASSYYAQGVSIRDGSGFGGNEFYASIASRSIDPDVDPSVSHRLRTVRDRYFAAVDEDVRRALSDGSMTRDAVEEWSRGLDHEFKARGVTDWEPLRERLNAILAEGS